MSLTAQAIEARAQISRSNLLFIDTRSLRFVTGLHREQALSPKAIQELLEVGELDLLNISGNGIAKYRLTDEAFKQAIMRRRRAKGHRIDWAYHVLPAVSGINPADSLFDGDLSQHAIIIPFNRTLLDRLLNATHAALEAHRIDPRLVGATTRLPAYLTPMELVTLTKGNDFYDIIPAFEDITVNVDIDIEYATYQVGTQIHDFWASGAPEPILTLLSKAAENLGDLTTRNINKIASRLERETQLTNPAVNPDGADPAVIALLIEHPPEVSPKIESDNP